MKRVSLFIGLKLVEIAGVVFIPYWIGLLMFGCPGFDTVVLRFLAWIVGFLMLAVVFLILLLVFIIYESGLISGWIKLNWKLAGKILRNKP